MYAELPRSLQKLSLDDTINDPVASLKKEIGRISLLFGASLRNRRLAPLPTLSEYNEYLDYLRVLSNPELPLISPNTPPPPIPERNLDGPPLDVDPSEVEDFGLVRQLAELEFEDAAPNEPLSLFEEAMDLRDELQELKTSFVGQAEYKALEQQARQVEAQLVASLEDLRAGSAADGELLARSKQFMDEARAFIRSQQTDSDRAEFEAQVSSMEMALRSGSVRDHLSRALTPPPEDEYVIEAVVGHEPSMLGTHTLFNVKWKGYDLSENTTEPLSNVKDTEALKTYLRDNIVKLARSQPPNGDGTPSYLVMWRDATQTYMPERALDGLENLSSYL